MQTLYIVGYSSVKGCLQGADVIIEPEVSDFSLTDFHRIDEYVEIGEQAARAAIPVIKEILS